LRVGDPGEGVRADDDPGDEVGDDLGDTEALAEEEERKGGREDDRDVG
jgi:hypothetical protein